MIKALIGAVLALILSSSAHAQDFRLSKYLAETRIFVGKYRTDIYCGCRFDESKNVKFYGCPYKPKANEASSRAFKIEWEHVVPAYELGKDRQCWIDGGRANCIKVDKTFRKMEGDLHNIRPAIGEVNKVRSNYQYGIVPYKHKTFGACQSFVNVRTSTFEPRNEVKGDVARISLYMNDKYALGFDQEFVYMLMDWSDADPVDETEREINKRIEAIQGDANPYVN